MTVLSTPRMLTMTMMVFWMRMTSCNFTSVVIMSLDMDSVIRFSKWTLNVSKDIQIFKSGFNYIYFYLSILLQRRQLKCPSC